MISRFAGQLSKFGEKSKQLSGLAIDVLYPPLCIACGSEVATRGFCSVCFPQFELIAGTCCETCATPLVGDSAEDVQCDQCLSDNPPWISARAVAIYGGAARKVVMSLKHSDRLDLGPVMARMMFDAGRDLPKPDLVVPIPIHWRRLMKRRYNQAAELARPIARAYNAACIPSALKRNRLTYMQKEMSRDERIAQQSKTIEANPKYQSRFAGKRILLVDDVFTTGATLRAAANACLLAHAKSVNVIVFSRVVAPWEKPI